MNVGSKPKSPKHRAIVGDYAVRQNASDRSNAALNDLMDQRFRPAHERWSAAKASSQQAATELKKAVRSRDAADKKLDGSVQRVLKAIRLSRGDGAPELAEYVPGGNMAQAKAPLATQLPVLEPYLARIAAAPDELIPAAVKAEVAQAVDEARRALAHAEACDRADAEARKARESLEPEWSAAYGDYHRGVEYHMQNDVARIEKLIYRYPPLKPKKGPSSVASASEASSSDPSSSGATEASSTAGSSGAGEAAAGSG